jgi:hypothetical protein
VALRLLRHPGAVLLAGRGDARVPVAKEDDPREVPMPCSAPNLPAAVRLAVIEVPSQLGTSLFTSRSFTFYLQSNDEAERVGFEPTRRLNTAYAISNRAPSANSDTSPGSTDGSLPKTNLLLLPFSRSRSGSRLPPSPVYRPRTRRRFRNPWPSAPGRPASRSVS